MSIYKTVLFIITISFIGPNLCHAKNYNLPVLSGRCPKGSIGTTDNNTTNYCWITGATMDGTALFGANGKFDAGNGISTDAEFSGSYVPYDGEYKIREHICSSSVQARCSVKSSSMYIDSAKTNNINSKQDINSQGINWGGNGRSLSVPYSFNMCFTLVSSDGHEWSKQTGTECSDASTLPTVPAICTINYNDDLPVAFGNVERNSISAQVGGTDKKITKTVPVQCTGDSALTMSMTFKYTPMSVGGDQVVQTSTQGLGVAILYNGKAMKPTDAVDMAFQPGASQFDLEFEAVRSPSVAENNIAAGDFSANAVLVMTEK